MSTIIIDKTYGRIINEVSDWMIEEYADYSEIKVGCIYLAEMLNHGKLIKDMLNSSGDENITLFSDSLNYLNNAVNDLICNVDKRENLKNVNFEDLKKLNIYLDKLIQEVKQNENI